MKLQILLAAVYLSICSCGASADHFPAENEEKQDYLENQREEYDPPRGKGDIEEKAEEKIELNNEIEE